MTTPTSSSTTNGGFLGWIERTGNELPDPVFIFFYLIGGLVLLSLAAAGLGWSALHPTEMNAGGTGRLLIEAESLLSAENLRRLWVEMPATFTHFHPLGYVLVVMLGAGVAERAGLFETAMRAGVRNAPTALLTPIVALVAMLGNLAADAAYVVLIPLAAVIYAAAGRHPIAGIAASFAGVSGGFSANLFPGQLDALLFGITQEAVEVIVPGWQANIAGNWYFIGAMTFVFLPVIWYVTDKWIEPRLGTYSGGIAPVEDEADEEPRDPNAPLTAAERSGLRRAGLAALVVIGAWVVLTVGPGTPLIDVDAPPEGRLTPFYRSLVAGFMVFFLATAWVYGRTVGTVKSHRDIVEMMAGAMKDLGYYLVLAFAAAHFVAMFNWSNLGLIFAVQGAGFLESLSLPAPILIALVVVMTGLLNLFVGSASAKWALMAPVLVPMLMLLGFSPEMATAAYRVGDGATNIITPLMVYFPLILIFCQRWQKDFGLGSLAALMLPYSVGLFISGTILLMVWVGLEIPLGPGSPVDYVMPSGVAPTP